jgi:uncharacterized protein (TIGR02145 family)
MYNWYAVNSVNQLCPIGWHIPSDAEWNILISTLDPNYNPTVVGNIQSNTAGGIMKNTGTQYWLSPNQGATNTTGFSALPGGTRLDNGSFLVLNLDGNWWSRTEGSNNKALYRYLPYSAAFVYRLENLKSIGFSVRCLKD